MSTLRDSLQVYLAVRRGLGAELRGPAVTLGRFVDFLDAQGALFITTDLALRFATAQPTTTTATRGTAIGAMCVASPLSAA